MHRFELKPNCSIACETAFWFYGSLVVVSLSVALGFALVGFWPVLPFAGLELLILLACVHRQLLRAGFRDWIEIDADTVRIRKLRGEDESETAFQRGWATVELTGSGQTHRPRELAIRSSKRRCLVGEFLTDTERLGLNRRLREILA